MVKKPLGVWGAKRVICCFIAEVPDADRQAATLESLLLQHILPGSHIISDGWRSYGNLSTLGGGTYTCEVILHEQHFVDPHNPEIHTQNTDMWMRAK